MKILIIALFLCLSSCAEGESWKVYAEKDKTIFYYDKHSIRYPFKTKGLFGLRKTDKDYVRVWIRFESGNTKFMSLEEISCSKRIRKAIENLIRKNDTWENFIDPFAGNDYTIVPGTHWDILCNIVCR